MDESTVGLDVDEGPGPPAPSGGLLAGRYLVLSLLGGGGMGRVYLARDTELDELVAVKLLLRDRLEDPEVLARLRTEVRLARRVTHPNVARTFDIGVHAGQRFITLEFVEGESLGAILARGPLPIPVFLAAARELCDGLEAAHAVGVVHRDLKPANVLVAPDGRVVLTDFGVACLASSTEAWAASGTPRYMAPEQLEGRAVDARTDIYALGLVFFEMLTGKRPFQDVDAKVEIERRLVEPPPDLARSGVPEPIARIVRTAMATMPDHRYARASEFKADLATVTLPTAKLQLVGEHPTASGRSVAVLPPRTEGEVPAGLEDHVADTLRRLGLRVPSSAAVLALREDLPRELGRALDVDAVLELRLRRDGAQLEVESQLLGVADGVLLHQLRTRVPADHLMKLSLRIVSGVGAALGARHALPGTSSATLLDDPPALALYTQARRLYHQRWAEPNDRACALLERALVGRPLDPTLLAALAAALARRLAYGADDELDRALDYAERARRLAPWSPESHVASASLHGQLAENEGAVRDLRTAIRLAPWHAESHSLLGELVAEAGLVEDAARHLTIAAALDPAFESPGRWVRARLLALDGDVASADRTMGPPPAEEWSKNPYFIQRSRLLLYDATPDRISAYRAAAGTSTFDLKFVAEALAGAIESRSDIELLCGLLARWGAPGRSKRRSSFFQVLRCELSAFGGIWDEARAALGIACELGLADAFWIDRCKLLDPLREDPVFRVMADEVCARGVGVAETYRRS